MTDHKATLRAVTLELRRELEGWHDADGAWPGRDPRPEPGDLERRLAELGVWRHRPPLPASAITWRRPEDQLTRRVVDGFLESRIGAGISLANAVAEFVRESAYTWANRLLALRCMEARNLIDEVILQKEVYGGRSLRHHQLARREPARCAGEDEGLFAMLADEFAERAEDLPVLFDPHGPAIALRPSVPALKRCLALLSGTETLRSQDPATDDTFTAPDALGWAYQYWNVDEKDRVFETVRTKKGAKIEGADIVPATCIYTEPYMVRFLVQNSLGASWTAMHPGSDLFGRWTYYVRGADRAPTASKRVREITFLDPACGSGHFLLEAFDLFLEMYEAEGEITEPEAICTSILEHNLFGIDIDGRAVQIAALALYMRAKERARDLKIRRVNVVATNIRIPSGEEPIERFLERHPEDAPLRPAIAAIFQGLGHADELGTLLHVEQPVDRILRALKTAHDSARDHPEQHALWPEMAKPVQGSLPLGVDDYAAWKQRTLERLSSHFAAEATGTDPGAAFFGAAAAKGVSLVDLLARRYDIVATNPPYMGSKNMGPVVKRHVERHFAPGKRDLYAAFILRCLELVAPGGRVAMVTQQSWMFLRSFAKLRALDDEEVRDDPDAFAGVLRGTTIETLAHLGPHAFSEIGGEVVNIVLFVLAATLPDADHRLTAFRLVGPKSPEEKDRLLREAVAALRDVEPAHP